MSDASTSTYTAVDLSRLPAPQIIGQVDYETIYAGNLAKLLEYFPDFDATVESDPAVKLLELFSWRETVIRAEFNDRAKGNMLAYASGGDLDNLAAPFGVTRLLITPGDPTTDTPDVMESDADFKRRILLAPEGYSVAGPEGAYIFHALTGAPAASDASATSPSPGDVVVTILARDGDGTAPQDLLDAVLAYLSDKTRRPLTDHVTVQSATIVPFAIEATVTTYAGPDSSLVLAQQQAQVEAYVAESFKLGRDVTRFSILAAMGCAGVQNVTLSSPAVDIVLDRTQAAHCTGITITYAGVGE